MPLVFKSGFQKLDGCFHYLIAVFPDSLWCRFNFNLRLNSYSLQLSPIGMTHIIP